MNGAMLAVRRAAVMNGAAQDVMAEDRGSESRWALAVADEVPRAKTAGCRKTPPQLRW